MKISLKHKHQTVEKLISPACTVIEYPINNEMLDMAIAKVSGRYPEERRIVNNQCAELAYVFEGKGKIIINNDEHNLNAGDAVLIEAGEKYYWEGHMKLFISCRPAWNKEQHQSVD